MTANNAEPRSLNEKKFVVGLAVLAVVAAFVPAIYAVINAPTGSSYIGFEYNTDDQMVYAAWMRQAMSGHLLMDNRFTTDAQPGLTIHLYFFVLGLVAKITGIAIAAALGRAIFSLLFVALAYRLVRRLQYGIYGTKLSMVLVIVGTGIGFLVWHNFGVAIIRPEPSFVNWFLKGQLPTDIWQPEAFVFSSMLTNGLFMVSLCLILTVFLSFLSARENKKAILPGFLAIGLLMNIHSYDVLTVGLVMSGFLAATLVQKQATWTWIGRVAAIVCGVVAPAAWFVHVLSLDAVFRARAATETYSPNFRQVLGGYLVMMVLGFCALFMRALSDEDKKTRTRRLTGTGLAMVVFMAMTILAGSAEGGYFLNVPLWSCAFLATLGAVALMSDKEPTWNLMVSWAMVGTIAIYFPDLFQRKLAMGLSIPWAVLSAYALERMMSKADRHSRNLCTILAITALGATSIRWLFREIQYVKLNVSNTERHPVYLSPDMRRIIDVLNDLHGRNVLLALPGAKTPAVDEQNHQDEIPDDFSSPLVPDMAPICSGLTGIYSYAGHWSETPDYMDRTSDMYRFFLRSPFLSVHRVMSDQERAEFIQKTGATYAVMPSPETFAALPLVNASDLGQVVFKGSQLYLIKLKG